MIDKEKSKKALECCSGQSIRCGDCPYYPVNTDDADFVKCNDTLCADALELLKKQQHKIWELNEINEYLDDVKKDQEHQIDVLKEQFDKGILVRCKDCKYGSLYCTEDVCGETLIECNRPDVGDVIEIHGWKWFCADGERKEGR